MSTKGTSSAVVALLLAARAHGGGILPERVNQIIIQGKFADRAPAFLVVFSAKPLRDKRGRTLTRAKESELLGLESSTDVVKLRLFGKPVSRGVRLDYFFGTKYDADRPWNDGTDFAWQDWAKHSPDVWDNIAIAALPADDRSHRAGAMVVTSVTVRRGGKILYDSRVRKSYPNQRPIDVALSPTTLTPRRTIYPLLNLAVRMNRFRDAFYELNGNPILSLAYSDLGQTEKSKYANRGRNWCSEFASYVYRKNGIMTPDPNRADVHWKNVREHFERAGKVYSMREVARWSDRKKIGLIKPGSFASILIGESTHSIIFTGWVKESGSPITKYVGLSGNNQGMVWAHAPMSLPSADKLRGKTARYLRDYDQKVYFAVPAASRGRNGVR